MDDMGRIVHGWIAQTSLLVGFPDCFEILWQLSCTRQRLWTADRRTPPGQECSNGSLLLFAVVL